jgi:hypothetical protein
MGDVHIRWSDCIFFTAKLHVLVFALVCQMFVLCRVVVDLTSDLRDGKTSMHQGGCYLPHLCSVGLWLVFRFGLTLHDRVDHCRAYVVFNTIDRSRPVHVDPTHQYSEWESGLPILYCCRSPCVCACVCVYGIESCPCFPQVVMPKH